MSELTDEDKIAWLWNKVDTLNSHNMSLTEENRALKSNIERLNNTVAQLSKEVAIMGVELNSARSAAFNAVHDYIASKE